MDTAQSPSLSKVTLRCLTRPTRLLRKDNNGIFHGASSPQPHSTPPSTRVLRSETYTFSPDNQTVTFPAQMIHLHPHEIHPEISIRHSYFQYHRRIFPAWRPFKMRLPCMMGLTLSILYLYGIIYRHSRRYRNVARFRKVYLWTSANRREVILKSCLWLATAGQVLCWQCVSGCEGGGRSDTGIKSFFQRWEYIKTTWFKHRRTILYVW